jgi:hypothetical protein
MLQQLSESHDGDVKIENGNALFELCSSVLYLVQLKPESRLFSTLSLAGRSNSSRAADLKDLLVGSEGLFYQF